jgi:hypothetical protein
MGGPDSRSLADASSKLTTVTMEQSSAPAPLPADAIRTGEAIALLAGKTLKQNSTAYIRHQGRLVRGAEQGRLTEYKLGPRRPRYWSRAEVLALRDSLGLDGFTDKPPSNYHRRTVQASVKRAERKGLIYIAEAAELRGVTIGGARKWFRQGRFGACKLGGLAFFNKAAVEAYRRRTPRQPPEMVPCFCCGERFPMKASKARKARAAAKKAESDKLLVFCPECYWTKPEARKLAHSRCVWRCGYPSPRRAAGIKRQWAEGKRDREAYAESNRQTWRSPKEAVKRADASTRKRYGHPLSDPRKVERNARRRAQAASDRSQQTRTLELKVTELWATGATQMAIANEVHVTPQRLGQIVRDLGLQPRPRGRPPRAM